MEAIVSSDYRQRMKGATPAVEGPLLNHACCSYADIGITALMPSSRLCRDGVARVHVFPALEEIDLAVTRHNHRPIADLHHRGRR
jgi:hypothetical protein